MSDLTSDIQGFVESNSRSTSNKESLQDPLFELSEKQIIMKFFRYLILKNRQKFIRYINSKIGNIDDLENAQKILLVAFRDLLDELKQKLIAQGYTRFHAVNFEEHLKDESFFKELLILLLQETIEEQSVTEEELIQIFLDRNGGKKEKYKQGTLKELKQKADRVVQEMAKKNSFLGILNQAINSGISYKAMASTLISLSPRSFPGFDDLDKEAKEELIDHFAEKLQQAYKQKKEKEIKKEKTEKNQESLVEEVERIISQEDFKSLLKEELKKLIRENNDKSESNIVDILVGRILNFFIGRFAQENISISDEEKNTARDILKQKVLEILKEIKAEEKNEREEKTELSVNKIKRNIDSFLGKTKVKEVIRQTFRKNPELAKPDILAKFLLLGDMEDRSAVGLSFGDEEEKFLKDNIQGPSKLKKQQEITEILDYFKLKLSTILFAARVEGKKEVENDEIKIESDLELVAFISYIYSRFESKIGSFLSGNEEPLDSIEDISNKILPALEEIKKTLEEIKKTLEDYKKTSSQRKERQIQIFFEQIKKEYFSAFGIENDPGMMFGIKQNLQDLTKMEEVSTDELLEKHIGFFSLLIEFIHFQSEAYKAGQASRFAAIPVDKVKEFAESINSKGVNIFGILERIENGKIGEKAHKLPGIVDVISNFFMEDFNRTIRLDLDELKQYIENYYKITEGLTETEFFYIVLITYAFNLRVINYIELTANGRAYPGSPGGSEGDKAVQQPTEVKANYDAASKSRKEDPSLVFRPRRTENLIHLNESESQYYISLRQVLYFIKELYERGSPKERKMAWFFVGKVAKTARISNSLNIDPSNFNVLDFQAPFPDLFSLMGVFSEDDKADYIESNGEVKLKKIFDKLKEKLGEDKAIRVFKGWVNAMPSKENDFYSEDDWIPNKEDLFMYYLIGDASIDIKASIELYLWKRFKKEVIDNGSLTKEQKQKKWLSYMHALANWGEVYKKVRELANDKPNELMGKKVEKGKEKELMDEFVEMIISLLQSVSMMKNVASHLKGKSGSSPEEQIDIESFKKKVFNKKVKVINKELEVLAEVYKDKVIILSFFEAKILAFLFIAIEKFWLIYSEMFKQTLDSAQRLKFIYYIVEAVDSSLTAWPNIKDALIQELLKLTSRARDPFIGLDDLTLYEQFEKTAQENLATRSGLRKVLHLEKAHEYFLEGRKPSFVSRLIPKPIKSLGVNLKEKVKATKLYRAVSRSEKQALYQKSQRYDSVKDILGDGELYEAFKNAYSL